VHAATSYLNMHDQLAALLTLTRSSNSKQYPTSWKNIGEKNPGKNTKQLSQIVTDCHSTFYPMTVTASAMPGPKSVLVPHNRNRKLWAWRDDKWQQLADIFKINQKSYATCMTVDSLWICWLFLDYFDYGYISSWGGSCFLRQGTSPARCRVPHFRRTVRWSPCSNAASVASPGAWSLELGRPPEWPNGDQTGQTGQTFQNFKTLHVGDSSGNLLHLQVLHTFTIHLKHPKKTKHLDHPEGLEDQVWFDGK
jgi:hypothetical protein